MVRKLLSLLMALLLFPAAAIAERVIDDAQALSDAVEARLEEELASIVQAYQTEMIVLITRDVPDDYSDDLHTVQAYADDYYDAGCYGVGDDHTGMLYLIDLNNRVQYISTCGRMIQVFGDAEMYELFDATQEYLAVQNWDEAMLVAVMQAKNSLQDAPETGETVLYSILRTLLMGGKSE